MNNNNLKKKNKSIHGPIGKKPLKCIQCIVLCCIVLCITIHTVQYRLFASICAHINSRLSKACISPAIQKQWPNNWLIELKNWMPWPVCNCLNWIVWFSEFWTIHECQHHNHYYAISETKKKKTNQKTSHFFAPNLFWSIYFHLFIYLEKQKILEIIRLR